MIRLRFPLRRSREGVGLAALVLVVTVVLVRCERSGTRSPDAASNECDGVSLLEDCGFELPVVAAGSYTLFAVGADISGWKVIGAPGNVAPLSTSYTSGGLTWPAHQGAQTLDLTGLTNSATGISQSVTTKLGHRYKLTFWVGNVVDPGGAFGTASTVEVLIDGHRVLTATNADGAGTRELVWKKFSVDFAAATASTAIQFLNADAATDNSNIIDDVVLVAAP